MVEINYSNQLTVLCWEFLHHCIFTLLKFNNSPKKQARKKGRVFQLAIVSVEQFNLRYSGRHCWCRFNPAPPGRYKHLGNHRNSKPNCSRILSTKSPTPRSFPTTNHPSHLLDRRREVDIYPELSKGLGEYRVSRQFPLNQKQAPKLKKDSFSEAKTIYQK